MNDEQVASATDAVGVTEIGILSVPQPIIFSILSYLRADEVWKIRTVSKSFLDVCEDYFREELRELVLDEQWLCKKSFGRTDHLLHICKSLTTLSIASEGKATFTAQVLTVLSRISKSTCKLREFSMKGFDRDVLDSFVVPNLTSRLLTVEKFVLDNVYCTDWRKVLASFFLPSYQYKSLQHLTLRLLKFDGLELQHLGDNAPSLTTLDVSYCSQLKSQYLQYALKRWCKLQSVYLQYVPSVKNSTIHILKEYCSDLRALWVQGTCVSVEALMSLASKEVWIDVLENQFNVTAGCHKMLLQI